MEPYAFRLAAPKKITVLAVLTLAIFLAAMACDAYTVFSWKDLNVYNRIGVIWRLATSAIMVAVLIGYLAASRYTVTDKGVRFMLGFIPVTRVKKGKITHLRVLKKTDRMLLFLGGSYFRVLIKPSLFPDFADALKASGATFTYDYDYEN